MTDAKFVSSRIASPCIAVCAMDEEMGYCKGCYRTRDEIGRWLTMTQADRALTVARAAERKADVA